MSDEVANAITLDAQQLREWDGGHLLVGLTGSDERLTIRKSEFVAEGDVSRGHLGLYGYAYRTRAIAGGQLDAVYGLAVERAEAGRVNAERETEHHLSPKLGLSWRRGRARLRLAGFRTLQRTLSAGRTLEPAHIHGFVQQYDGDPGARSTTSAIGADSHVRLGSMGGARVHYGAEWVRRDVDYATRRCPSPSTRDDDVALFLYVPGETLSASLELGRHERSGDDCALEIRSVALDTTHRVSLGLSRIWGNGVSLHLRPRYFTQSAETRVLDPQEEGESLASRFSGSSTVRSDGGHAGGRAR